MCDPCVSFCRMSPLGSRIWPCACCMCPRGDLRPCLALDLGKPKFKNGFRPTGSRGELQVLGLEANYRFLVSCRRTGTASNHSFYPTPACCRPYPVSCCCYRVLFLRRRFVRSRHMPVCRSLGAVVVPGGPLYQLVVLLWSSILTLRPGLFREDNHELMFPGTDRFLGCRLQGANDSTCLLNLTTFVPGRIS